MSSYTEDDYEEIPANTEGGEDEEELIDETTPQQQGRPIKKAHAPMLTDKSDEQEEEEPINEEEDTDKNDEAEQGEPISAPQQPISVRPNNFAPINDKRAINKKANAIKFFKTFIRNKNRTMDEVTREVNITRTAGKQYLAEYVQHVMNAVDSGQFPTRVVMAYNDQSMPKHQRLTAQDVQDMKPIILKYHAINIDSLVGDADKKGVYRPPQARADPIIREFVDDLGGGAMPQQARQPLYEDEEEGDEEDEEPPGPYKRFNDFKQSRPQSSARKLTQDSSIGDVLEFGIINSGQTDMAKIKRIKTMFLSNPPFYLSDESRFTDLLEANEIKPKVLATFMDWLKYIAPIKPNERIGFLATASPQQGANYQQQQVPQHGGQRGAMMNQPFKKFDINEYDDYAQFLYTEGVYQYGLPPEHPINKQGYQRYMDDKKYEEDQKKTMRQIDMMVKQNILRMGPGGGTVGMNGQGQQGGPATAFDERYLIERGVLVPEITYTEDGKKITRLIPTGRPMNGGYGGYMGGENPEKDDFTDSISKFSRFLEAVRPMMQPQGAGTTPTTNPIVDRLMEAAVNKLFNKAEETPSQVLEHQMGLFEKFKSLYPQTEGQPLNETQARLQIELAKLNTDKDFHLQEVAFKQRQLEMEEKRHEDAKSESKDGLTWIMDALGRGFTAFQPILTSLLMGQGGGGLSGMLGGALGGGGQQPPMGGMGMPPDMGMMGGQSPFTMPQGEPEVMDNIPPPTQVPQDFMPQQPQYDPYQQQQYQQQQQPQYQQQQQPQYSNASPQMEYPQPPPDFLPETPPEPFAVPQPTKSENDFLNSLTPEDLATLSVDELAEVERRISTKQNKLERVLNSIKSTKVRKQFGYRQQPEPPDYSALDVPKDIPSDYDGMPDYQPQETNPVTGGEMDENVPSEAERDFDVGVTAEPMEAEIAPLTPEEMLNTSFESFNNGVYEINDMGNDNQQFNQQNDANQKEFIDKMAALDKAEKLRIENEKRKAAGLAPLTELEGDKNVSEDAKKAADNQVHNKDDVIKTEEQAQRSKETKEQQNNSNKNQNKSHKSNNAGSKDETKKAGTEDLGSNPSKKKADESTTISNTKTVKTDLKEKK